MKAKILILIYLLIIGGVSYFAYPIIKNRYFQSTSNSEEISRKSSTANENNNLSLDDNTADDTENIPDESTVDDNVLLDISPEDCDSNCDQFEDSDEKKYCLEYCGINDNSGTSTDCDSLIDLEKDYCYKKQAISKKDFILCKKIIDKKILESCKNQLTEEVLNDSKIDE
ncbi:MAG: hypothetical protein WC682_03345 [Parcubacteria group bacterium]|jgi:hypothetical protein